MWIKTFSSVQLLSHVRLFATMNCSTPGLPVHHHLPEFTQTHVHRVSDAIQPSHPVVPFSSCPQSLPASESFPMSQLFAGGGQSIGVSCLLVFYFKCIYLAVLGLDCCARAFSSCREWGLLFSVGFSLQWLLLLQSTGSRAFGLQ